MNTIPSIPAASGVSQIINPWGRRHSAGEKVAGMSAMRISVGASSSEQDLAGRMPAPPGNFPHRLVSRMTPVLVLLVSLAASTLHAQSFSIDWFSIDGGSATSTGGVFAVSGTVGQPDANLLTHSAGNFALEGGFWSINPFELAAPRLAIRLTPTNTAQVYWSSPSTGFALQQNALINTTNWVPAPEPVVDNGTNKFIIINPPTGTRFYRLLKP